MTSTNADLLVVERALNNAQSRQDFQRVLCIWLKLSMSMTSREIARAIGWNSASVRRIQSQFARQGPQIFSRRQKGGRRRENMPVTREKQILQKFLRSARHGCPLDVQQIKKTYELSLGKEVSESTVYRLIRRHGLRPYLPTARNNSRRGLIL